MNVIDFCNRVIRYSFYALFIGVPIFFTSDTFELFEFNKMWLAYGLSIVILGAWVSKMILQKKFFIQKTFLDIPLGLFLLSQVIATLFSLDSHVSFWGYYSRFNGGLLSIITYIFLFYALVTNLTKQHIMRLFVVILAAGLFVTLWGIPGHFGYDPTCLLFRGSLDVSCWSEDFQPKIRIFSTLGQPNWLAAYLAALIPLGIILTLLAKKILHQIFFGTSTVLFYIALIFTASRSGFAGLVAGLVVFFSALFFATTDKIKTRFAILLTGILFYFCLTIFLFKDNVEFAVVGAIAFLLFISFLIYKGIRAKHQFLVKERKAFITLVVLLTTCSLLFGTPVTPKLNDTFSAFSQKASKSPKSAPTSGTSLESGGTESGTIRLIVWQGALDAWRANPIFGTGVETYAYAYYKYKPQAHNMTSEWDFIYNKAHNEYLNYLATTGLFGLTTYLLIIIFFCYRSLRALLQAKEASDNNFLTASLLAGYVSILVSNFLGFSVVIINLFFFLIPAMYVVLTKKQETQRYETQANHVSSNQWISVAVVNIICILLIFNLYTYWIADKAYAQGYNLNRAGEYQSAYIKLREAVNLRPDEPVYLDELAINQAIIAAALMLQDQATPAAQRKTDALRISDYLTDTYPKNTLYWKSRVKVFDFLSQADPKYLTQVLESSKKIKVLSPNDAKVSYNLGITYGKTGNVLAGIKELRHTIQLKPDYRDAYFALGLFYRDQAVDENGNIINAENQKQAEYYLNYILQHFAKDDKQVLDTLKTWETPL